MAKKPKTTPWDLWDYQLALCYRLWRAFPHPPSKKKEPEKWAIFDRMMKAAMRDFAIELHSKRPPLEDRVKPWPKDPEDVLEAKEQDDETE